MLGKLLLITVVLLAAVHRNEPRCQDGLVPDPRRECEDNDDCPENQHCRPIWPSFVCCPEPIDSDDCPNWTEWFDVDDPDKESGEPGAEEGGSGDAEHLLKLRRERPGQICDNPTAIQARVVAPDGRPAENTGETFVFYDIMQGFMCYNQHQRDHGEMCEDYEVRFCCPEFEPVEEPPANASVPSPCSIDIVIVIDVSSSMSDFEFLPLRWFLLDLTLCFDGIDAQVGIISYACLPKLDIPLSDYSKNPGFLDAISGLERTGGKTRTGLALHYVKCVTDFREEECSVVILVSDGNGANGQGTDDYIAQAAMLRDSGIELYAVAAGNPLLVNTAALATITGNPDRVVSPDDPCGLANRIIEECCEEN